MTTNLSVTVSCGGCGGTGNQPLHPSGSVPCFLCNGTGKFIIGAVSLDPGLDDILDKCNDILDKCNDILEAVKERNRDQIRAKRQTNQK